MLGPEAWTDVTRVGLKTVKRSSTVSKVFEDSLARNAAARAEPHYLRLEKLRLLIKNPKQR